MTLGESVKVLCPSSKAYGSRGAGGKIPPNADLYFEIDMISFGKHKWLKYIYKLNIEK